MEFRDLISRIDGLQEEAMPIGGMPINMDQQTLSKIQMSNPALFQQIVKNNPSLAAVAQPSATQQPTQAQTAPGPQSQPTQASTAPGQQADAQKQTSQIPPKNGGIGGEPAMQGKAPQEGFEDLHTGMKKLTDSLVSEDDKETPEQKKARIAKAYANKEKLSPEDIKFVASTHVNRITKDPTEFFKLPKVVQQDVLNSLPVEAVKYIRAENEIRLRKPDDPALADWKKQSASALTAHMANVNKPADKPAETPVKPAETPVKPAETPVKPAETPVKPAETPVKPAKDPSLGDNEVDVTPPKKKEWAKGVVGRGQSGEQVGKIQQQLKDLGYDIGETDVDQKFGPKTQAAVQKFQADQGLKGREGAVGRETAPALEKALAAKSTPIKSEPVTPVSADANLDSGETTTKPKVTDIASGEANKPEVVDASKPVVAPAKTSPEQAPPIHQTNTMPIFNVGAKDAKAAKESVMSSQLNSLVEELLSEAGTATMPAGRTDDRSAWQATKDTVGKGVDAVKGVIPEPVKKVASAVANHPVTKVAGKAFGPVMTAINAPQIPSDARRAYELSDEGDKVGAWLKGGQAAVNAAMIPTTLALATPAAPAAAVADVALGLTSAGLAGTEYVRDKYFPYKGKTEKTESANEELDRVVKLTQYKVGK